MRRTMLNTTRIITFAFLCLTIACTNSASTSQPQPPQDQMALSALARDTNPQVSDADLTAVIAGATDFALKIFPLLDPGGNSNTVFSPFSITQAFALAAPGARGTTLSGIEQAMSFPLPQERLTTALNKLDLLLRSEATGSITTTGDRLPILKNANAIWGQAGFSILPTYLDTLAVNYGAGMHLVDFINETEAARNTINTWVESQTNNRIPDLIPEGGVSPDTRVVLTNAVWFKANWATQFSEESTTNQSFFNQTGPSSSVPFMKHKFMAPYAQADGCQAVDIPYAGDKFSMLVLMPIPGTLNAFLSSFTPTVLGDITNHLADKEIDLSLPKFTFTKDVSLGAFLRSVGMIDAFDPAVADFSGIDGNRDLVLGDVFHKAFISVDEHGTEAAAATAITIGTTGYTYPLALEIDHPYIFLIRERQTGLILFIGKVLSL